jgi:DNA polymerase-1
VAMLAVHREIAQRGLRSRMLLQVHDELLFEAAPGELDRLTELVHTEMCDAFELTVPLEVSMGTGRSWADAAH